MGNTMIGELMLRFNMFKVFRSLQKSFSSMVIDGGLTPFKCDFQNKTTAAISKSKSHSHYQHPSLPLSKLKLFLKHMPVMYVILLLTYVMSNLICHLRVARV